MYWIRILLARKETSIPYLLWALIYAESAVSRSVANSASQKLQVRLNILDSKTASDGRSQASQIFLGRACPQTFQLLRAHHAVFCGLYLCLPNQNIFLGLWWDFYIKKHHSDRVKISAPEFMHNQEAVMRNRVNIPTRYVWETVVWLPVVHEGSHKTFSLTRHLRGCDTVRPVRLSLETRVCGTVRNSDL